MNNTLTRRLDRLESVRQTAPRPELTLCLRTTDPALLAAPAEKSGNLTIIYKAISMGEVTT